jgi:hypothetical protein
MNILGLDISSSTIGFTVLNEKECLICNYVKPKGNNIWEKVESVEDTLFNLRVLKIDAIYVEQPNIMFSKGFSSAQVLSIILRFNGAILFTLYKNFNILPHEVMASSARKKVMGVGRFKSDAKQHVWDWVNKDIGNQPWPKIDKGKNIGKLKEEAFDMSDSYIIAKYGLINEQFLAGKV